MYYNNNNDGKKGGIKSLGPLLIVYDRSTLFRLG